MTPEHLISRRASTINGSGIRRVFDLGAKLKDPVNLSIGQPDFPVPEAIKRAAVRAIQEDKNGYTLTQGIAPLLDKIAVYLKRDVGWECAGATGPDAATSPSRVMVTSGTSGAILLACMAMLDPGDEVIIPDPWFVLYPHLGELCHANAVPCDTYPNFKMTAAKVEPLITAKTKAIILCSPGNPSGVVHTEREVADLLELCRRKKIILISDEIYDEFCYSEARTQARPSGTGKGDDRRCPSPARLPGSAENVLIVRGFGKTYGVTGWRLGYAAGPRWLIDQMIKLQQYTYVCAPTPLQWGAMEALDVDMAPHLKEYERRRDLVVDRLSKVTEVVRPGGAFYAFVKVADRLGYPEESAGEQFFQLCAKSNVLIVPGKTFSSRDTHFRLSFATPLTSLEKGLDVIAGLMAR